MIFSFINSFPSSSEENKFENVSPASKTARFLAFFNSLFFFHSLIASSFSYFEAYACFLLHFFFNVSFLHFQRIPDKMMPDKFEVLTCKKDTSIIYSQEFRCICAHFCDNIRLFTMMTTDEYLSRAIQKKR